MGENASEESLQSTFLQNLKVVMYNECKLAFQEFKPYLELPPDGPEQ